MELAALRPPLQVQYNLNPSKTAAFQPRQLFFNLNSKPQHVERTLHTKRTQTLSSCHRVAVAAVTVNVIRKIQRCPLRGARALKGIIHAGPRGAPLASPMDCREACGSSLNHKRISSCSRCRGVFMDRQLSSTTQ